MRRPCRYDLALWAGAVTLRLLTWLWQALRGLSAALRAALLVTVALSVWAGHVLTARIATQDQVMDPPPARRRPTPRPQAGRPAAHRTPRTVIYMARTGPNERWNRYESSH